MLWGTKELFLPADTSAKVGEEGGMMYVCTRMEWVRDEHEYSNNINITNLIIIAVASTKKLSRLALLCISTAPAVCIYE